MIHIAPQAGIQAEWFALLYSNRLAGCHRSSCFCFFAAGETKHLCKQIEVAALLEVGLGIGVHTALQPLGITGLKRLADLFFLHLGIEHPQKHRWVADVDLGLVVFTDQHPQDLLRIAHSLTA